MKKLFLLGILLTSGKFAIAQDTTQETTTVEGAEAPVQQEKVVTTPTDTAARQPQSVSKKKTKAKKHGKNKRHNKKKHHKNK